MIGHSVGETVEVEVSYPEDHSDPELAGKTGVMRATIKSLKGRKLPELDDDFAASVGDYDSLAALRESIRAQMQQASDEHADEEMRNQVLRFIVQGTEVELPEAMVEQATERSYEGLMEDLQRTGMSVEDFAEAVGADEETLRANQRTRAESGLKLHVALGKLRELREVEAEETDLLAEMMRLAADTGADLNMVQQAAALQVGFGEELRDRALTRKLIDGIVAEAEVEDVPIAEYEAGSVTSEQEPDEQVAGAAQGAAAADEASPSVEAEHAQTQDQESDEQ